jgi:hypothetical protein
VSTLNPASPQRRLALSLTGLVLWLAPSVGWTAEGLVPVQLQAELLAKVAAYDRNLPARAGDHVRVLVLDKSGDGASAQIASQVRSALLEHESIGSLPIAVEMLTMARTLDLAGYCSKNHIAIIYLCPGFSASEMQAIGGALDGVDVLTAGGLVDYVGNGAVLGFDLVSGKPKLVFHAARAAKQNVSIRAEVLRLMKVIDQ